MSPVLQEHFVSGMASLGTTPYFFTRPANMSHWPPSQRGSASRNAISRSFSGSAALAMMFSKNQLERSYLSQKSG